MPRASVAISILLMLISAFPLKSQNITWTAQFDSIASFSSPQAADLNGDGTKDIVFGGGTEGKYRTSGVIALDGKNGSVLWKVPARDQVYGTALFRDINADQVPDVFIGGRDAQFWAINGANGNILWEFWPTGQGTAKDSGWYNFYNPQWIADQDGDAVPDLLIANGGDAQAVAWDSNRPPGSIMLMSTMTGAVIARDTVPDGHETYLSPLAQDLDGSGDPWVFFGSGGETVRGSFWKTRLSNLKAGNISGAKALVSDTLKGFIPVPSLTDLNGDQVYDIILPRFNAGLLALNGATDSIIWQLDFPGYENYTSPTIGNFTGDPTPDVFGIIANGQWFFYGHFVKYLVDGATGQVVWTDTSYTMQLSQANALDWDNDGWDEVLLMHNFDIGSTTLNFQNIFRVADFQTGLLTDFGPQRNGTNQFSTPLIDDLDGDSILEVIYVFLPTVDDIGDKNGTRIQRMDLGRFTDQIAWGGFMGNNRDCVYDPPPLVGLNEDISQESELMAFPNPTQGKIMVKGADQYAWELMDIQGKSIVKGDQKSLPDLSPFTPGLYLLLIQSSDQAQFFKVFKF